MRMVVPRQARAFLLLSRDMMDFCQLNVSLANDVLMRDSNRERQL